MDIRRVHEEQQKSGWGKEISEARKKLHHRWKYDEGEKSKGKREREKILWQIASFKS